MPPKPPARSPDDPAYFYSWAAFDRVFATNPQTTTLTRPSTPSDSLSSDDRDTYRRGRVPHTRPMAPEPFATPGRSGSHASTSSWSASGPVTPNDSEPLDEVWARVRQQKAAELEARPSKVQSLETCEEGVAPVAQHHQPARDNMVRGRQRTQKSTARREAETIVQFQDSADGLRVTATFDLGVPKHDMDVAFKGNRLIVTWHTVHETEFLEGVIVYREREERYHTRTIPVPENTKFEEIVATYSHGKLVVSYPKARTVRARPRGSSQGG
ncbi:hypothetical protein K488DRAFT_72447 [Vararia minispora EC-137]|uniref:Uncharacterized protein n=1 Tax=Vararia minispora EC-137 TaxID=1314806 RepID=A0ACB8QEF9_9AGAM|nr:hypothetical protein K488DRAFT_72447 [Vararia minispora EC-137]